MSKGARRSSKKKAQEKPTPAAAGGGLVAVLRETRQALRSLVLEAGFGVFAELLEEDRETLCGPRHSRSDERRAYRHGYDEGRLVKGGRQVRVVQAAGPGCRRRRGLFADVGLHARWRPTRRGGRSSRSCAVSRLGSTSAASRKSCRTGSTRPGRASPPCRGASSHAPDARSRRFCRVLSTTWTSRC